MSASSSRKGYALLSRQSNDDKRPAPLSASKGASSSVNPNPASNGLNINIYITYLFRFLATLFSIISITLYLVVITTTYYNIAVYIYPLVPLFLSLIGHLAAGISQIIGRQKQIKVQWISSKPNSRGEQWGGGKDKQLSPLSVWDFGIGVVLCLTVGPVCAAVFSQTIVIVAVVGNFGTAIIHFIALIPTINHFGMAVTLAPASKTQYELAEPKSPDVYHDAEAADGVEPVTAESLV